MRKVNVLSVLVREETSKRFIIQATKPFIESSTKKEETETRLVKNTKRLTSKSNDTTSESVNAVKQETLMNET